MGSGHARQLSQSDGSFFCLSHYTYSTAHHFKTPLVRSWVWRIRWFLLFVLFLQENCLYPLIRVLDIWALIDMTFMWSNILQLLFTQKPRLLLLFHSLKTKMPLLLQIKKKKTFLFVVVRIVGVSLVSRRLWMFQEWQCWSITTMAEENDKTCLPFQQVTDNSSDSLSSSSNQGTVISHQKSGYVIMTKNDKTLDKGWQGQFYTGASPNISWRGCWWRRCRTEITD